MVEQSNPDLTKSTFDKKNDPWSIHNTPYETLQKYDLWELHFQKSEKTWTVRES